MTKLDVDNIWKIVKKIRLSFLLTYPGQDCSGQFLSDGNMQDILNNLAAKLKLNPTSNPNKNVSDKILETAAKMFVYLNFCPSLIPKHIFLQTYLFRTATPTEIIVALSRKMKTLQNMNEKGNIIEVFGKLMEYLKLESYKEVQSITKKKYYSNSTNIDSKKQLNITSKCFYWIRQDPMI